MKDKVISLPIFSRFCMFCALLGQDIRYQVSVYRTIGPLIQMCWTTLAVKKENFTVMGVYVTMANSDVT